MLALNPQLWIGGLQLGVIVRLVLGGSSSQQARPVYLGKHAFSTDLSILDFIPITESHQSAALKWSTCRFRKPSLRGHRWRPGISTFAWVSYLARLLNVLVAQTGTSCRSALFVLKIRA